MSIWNKIKNSLFEDEEEDLTEEKLSSAKKANKKKEKDAVKEEEFKVAKKIELPEQQPLSKEELEEFPDEPESFSSRLEKTQKYTMELNEEDFADEQVVNVAKEKRSLPEWKDAAGAEKKSQQAPYEGLQDKQVFMPTPIISPIYGILDKNYRKEDVVTKREIRLSTTSSRKPDIDTVREKAYGEENEPIIRRRSDKLEQEEIEEVEYEKEEGLIDLNASDAPAVDSVSVGDAEEYFDELGLEYNVDYKDESVEKAKPKPRKPELVEEEEFEETEELEIIEEDSDDGDNLFDLIEAMYEEEDN